MLRVKLSPGRGLCVHFIWYPWNLMISTPWRIFLDMTDQNSMQSHVKSGLRSGYSSLNGESMGKAIVIFFEYLVKYKLYIIDKYRPYNHIERASHCLWQLKTCVLFGCICHFIALYCIAWHNSRQHFLLFFFDVDFMHLLITTSVSLSGHSLPPYRLYHTHHRRTGWHRCDSESGVQWYPSRWSEPGVWWHHPDSRQYADCRRRGLSTWGTC